jgi:hypothetical protein
MRRRTLRREPYRSRPGEGAGELRAVGVEPNAIKAARGRRPALIQTEAGLHPPISGRISRPAASLDNHHLAVTID